MWEVGQKVVCVDGRFPGQFYEWGDRVPVEDEIYTIRKIGYGTHGLTGKIALSFLLEEVINPEFEPGREVMFCEERFRPISSGAAYRNQAGKALAAAS